MQAVLLAALGFGLIRVGRRLVLPTFAILLLTALPHAIRAAEMFPHGGMAVLPAPLILGAVNILPVLLLLIGVPGRARVRAAWVVFVLAQLLALAASALNVYGSATGQ